MTITNIKILYDELSKYNTKFVLYHFPRDKDKYVIVVHKNLMSIAISYECFKLLECLVGILEKRTEYTGEPHYKSRQFNKEELLIFTIKDKLSKI